MVAVAATTFTRPGFAIFQQLLGGWVLCPGRHTITHMIRTMGTDARPHDAYQRLIQRGSWSLTTLWAALTRQVVTWFCPQGRIVLVLDDTLLHKSGRHVAGAGSFRDPVRSTKRRTVYAHGLNVVTLAVCFTPPWRRQPLALTVATQLYHKDQGRTRIDMAASMIEKLAFDLPGRSFELVTDGAYAAMAGRGLPRTHVVSRMRRDAALHDLPAPRQPGQRGRPRVRGPRLPTPAAIADSAPADQWLRTTVPVRGRLLPRLILRRTVLWYDVCGRRPVVLVIVRDPAGKEADDFFFTTRAAAPRRAVAATYALRWPTEQTYRDVKQFLGAHQPQSWKGVGPLRAVSVGFWLHTAVWAWYIRTSASGTNWTATPWHQTKRAPSFADALAALRATLLRHRFSTDSHGNPRLAQIAEPLIALLAHAA